MKVCTHGLLCSFIVAAIPSVSSAGHDGETSANAPIEAQPQSVRPQSGFAADEKTAVTIAEAVLGSTYGRKKIRRERPLHASPSPSGVWHIVRSLPENDKGGVASMEMSQRHGCILRVTHGK